jgi:hypothetical protein
MTFPLGREVFFEVLELDSFTDAALYLIRIALMNFCPVTATKIADRQRSPLWFATHSCRAQAFTQRTQLALGTRHQRGSSLGHARLNCISEIELQFNFAFTIKFQVGRNGGLPWPGRNRNY